MRCGAGYGYVLPQLQLQPQVQGAVCTDRTWAAKGASRVMEPMRWVRSWLPEGSGAEWSVIRCAGRIYSIQPQRRDMFTAWLWLWKAIQLLSHNKSHEQRLQWTRGVSILKQRWSYCRFQYFVRGLCVYPKPAMDLGKQCDVTTACAWWQHQRDRRMRFQHISP